MLWLYRNHLYSHSTLYYLAFFLFFLFLDGVPGPEVTRHRFFDSLLRSNHSFLDIRSSEFWIVKLTRIREYRRLCSRGW